jgi:hypothetical protein
MLATTVLCAPGPALPRRASLPAPNPGNRPLQRLSSGSLSSSLSIDFRPPVTDPASPSPPPRLPLPTAPPSSAPSVRLSLFARTACSTISFQSAIYFLTTILFTTLCLLHSCVIISLHLLNVQRVHLLIALRRYVLIHSLIIELSYTFHVLPASAVEYTYPHLLLLNS